MDKVIELLNVYRKEKYPKSKLRYYKYDSLNHEFLSNCIPNDSEEKVLGKRFGFIKWLVQKEKINFDKVMKLGIPCFVQYDNGEIISVHDVDFDRQLIMLLSISDTPIQDLISYLK